MNTIKEKALFFKGAIEDMNAVGSIIPSSRATGQAMSAYIDQFEAPRRILEVGAGTGPITAHIVEKLKPGDQFDIYEINPEFSAFLEKRFAREEKFNRVKSMTSIYAAGIETIVREPQYDVIVSAIPFSAFTPEMVREFFEIYRDILKPGGVLTFIEFAIGRDVLKFLAMGDQKERLLAVHAVIREYQEKYQIDRKFVTLNVPPSRIFSLQFS